MCRGRSFLALAVLCAALPLSCSRIDPAELTKARAETEAARAEAMKARADAQAAMAEAVKAKAEAQALRIGGGKSPENVPSNPGPPLTIGGRKPDLSGSGVAFFPDGKQRAFTNIRYLDRESTLTAVGRVGGGESPVFRFREILRPGDGKERRVVLDELTRISFGPVKMQPMVSAVGTKYEYPYSEVELEATDGRKERFDCYLYEMAVVVKYTDGIGKETLDSSQVGGLTFRADK